MTTRKILFENNGYKGIYSICSSDPFVLETSLKQALRDRSPLLVEATCNQVNQYGGYTGMKPLDFKNYVYSLAEKTGYNTDNLILGGDHLGTQPFKHLKSDEAVEKACIMVQEFVKAGFTKIHLDASVPCVDDTGLTKEELTINACERSAIMAERIADLNIGVKIDYVIGTEVPIPGGALEDDDVLVPTSVEDAEKVIEFSMKYLKKRNLKKVIDSVIALVVQPGVEFSNNMVHPYNRNIAAKLSQFIKSKDKLVFEAHSTDYQTTGTLKDLVDDGFAILKVGPALTYAKRRGLFALARIEDELFNDEEASHLIDVIEKVMVSQPDYWKSYYHGNEQDLKLSRRYSLSDRVRYYWSNKDINFAVDKLMKNLSRTVIPQTLVYEYIPELYWKIRDGLVAANDPSEIVHCYIQQVIEQYAEACGF